MLCKFFENHVVKASDGLQRFMMCAFLQPLGLQVFL